VFHKTTEHETTIPYLLSKLASFSLATVDTTGLSSPETMDALPGYTLLRTDQNGWIEIIKHGK
jgi:hypothetical protein